MHFVLFLFCFVVGGAGGQVYRHIIPSFPHLCFSLTTNQRENKLKDVRFAFTVQENGHAHPLPGEIDTVPLNEHSQKVESTNHLIGKVKEEENGKWMLGSIPDLLAL